MWGDSAAPQEDKAMNSERDKIIARLEELGETQVRLLLSKDGLPSTWNLVVIEWLGQKASEQKNDDDLWRDEQRKIANSAKRAAWIAAGAAIVAVLVSIGTFVWSH